MATVLTASQVAALCHSVWRSNTPGADAPGRAWSLGILRATYVALRESGGDIAAFRPAAQNPNGGNDRGLFQINSKYWPQVTDAIAFNPVTAIAAVWSMTKGFNDWGPWKTDRDPTWGLGSTNAHQAAAYNAAADAFLALSKQTILNNSTGARRPMTRADLDPIYASLVGGGASGGGGFDLGTVLDVGKVIAQNPTELAKGALDAATPDWMGKLGQLLGNLLDPGFWRRLGIGAAGLALIVAAFYVWRAGSVLSLAGGGGGRKVATDIEAAANNSAGPAASELQKDTTP